MSDENPELSFLKDGGEMGHLTRIHDWAQTPLGPAATWPQSLKTTLSIILNSRFPMFLFWGKELLCFYNDAYRPSMGNEGRHPHALGRPGAEIWPEIWQIIEPLLKQVLSGGESTWSEDQLIPIFRNGHLEDVYWTFSYSPVFDELARVTGVLVTCTETTDKVINFMKLAESKDQLHFAIEAAELATWDYNPATQKFVASARFKEWFGIPEDQEATLEEGLARITDEDRDRVEAAFSRAMDYSSGGKYLVEYTIANQNTGLRRNVMAKGRAWFDERQVAYRVNGTVQDVTREVEARQKIETEKKRFQTLLETMPNMAWTTTPRGEPTFINQRWYDYTGQKPDGVMTNAQWEQATHPDDLPAAIEKMLHSLETGEPYTVEYRIRHRGGNYRWHLARATAIRNESGQIAYWLGTITDIHEQKQSEARLDELVKQRTRQLEESVLDLQRSNENLQQFAYVASHDLQEPLRKIQAFGDILKNRFSDQLGEGRDYLDRMQSAASRMSVLIHDLLTYSRISTHRNGALPVPLEQVFKSVVLDLELAIKEKGATVVIPDTLPTVQGDGSQLRQLFQNLLSNSLKFQKPDNTPTIEVDSQTIAQNELPASVRPTRYAPSYCCISVADNGIGFEEQYLDRIFEVFQRLHGKSQYSGTDIGLAICQKVANNHGGAIAAASKPGVGATFSVYFPVLD